MWRQGEMTERSKLVSDLEAAVNAATDALASGVDALGSSRDTHEIVRKAMREAAATVADVDDTVAGPAIEPAPE
jgi:hypothetical protein